MCWYSRCLRRLQVLYVNRTRCGSDGIHALVIVLVKEQVREEIGRPQRDGSCCSDLRRCRLKSRMDRVNA